MNKINKGGNGAWGETNMPSFATLSLEERTALATYVLSLADVKKTLPLRGTVNLPSGLMDQHAFESNEEPKFIPSQQFELSATYTDKGGDIIGPITVKKSLLLQPPRLLLSKVVNLEKVNKAVELGHVNQADTVKVPATGAFLAIPLGRFDLTDIKSVRVGGWITEAVAPWKYELRAGSETGTLIASGDSKNAALESYTRTPLKLTAADGFQDLYLLVSGEKSGSELHLFDLSFHQ